MEQQQQQQYLPQQEPQQPVARPRAIAALPSTRRARLSQYVLPKNRAPLLRYRSPTPEQPLPCFVLTKGCSSNEIALDECLRTNLDEFPPDYQELLAMHREEGAQWMQQVIADLVNYQELNEKVYINPASTDAADMKYSGKYGVVRLEMLYRVDTMIRTEQRNNPDFEHIRTEMAIRSLAKQLMVARNFCLVAQNGDIELKDVIARTRLLNPAHLVIDIGFVLHLSGVSESRLGSKQWFSDGETYKMQSAQSFLHWQDQAELHLPFNYSEPTLKMHLENMQDLAEFHSTTKCALNGYMPTNLVCEGHYTATSDSGYMLISEAQKIENTLHLQTTQAKVNLLWGTIDKELMAENPDYDHLTQEEVEPESHQQQGQAAAVQAWTEEAEALVGQKRRPYNHRPNYSDGEEDDVANAGEEEEEEEDDDDMDANQEKYAKWWLNHVKPKLDAELQTSDPPEEEYYDEEDCMQ